MQQFATLQNFRSILRRSEKRQLLAPKGQSVP